MAHLPDTRRDTRPMISVAENLKISVNCYLNGHSNCYFLTVKSLWVSGYGKIKVRIIKIHKELFTLCYLLNNTCIV